LIHEGFIYSSEDEFGDVVAPFLREAVEAKQPALAVMRPERQETLRVRLGRAARGVTFLPQESWYGSRPGKALLAWTTALDDALAGQPSFVRAIGEPPLASETGREERWTRYESLFNRLYADAPISLICSYDARALSDDALDICRKTHPTLVEPDVRVPSPAYLAAAPGAVFAAASTPAGKERTAATATAMNELVALRPAVLWPARSAGLSDPDVQDLVLAVTELGRAALAESGGPVHVRTRPVGVRARTSSEAWLAEVELSGVGSSSVASGRGRLALMVGGIVADRIELGDAGNGVLVRFVFMPRARSLRDRILAAATELFGRKGIRATTVNEIAAQARVAKATFYSVFPSKDELVATWLRGTTTGWLDAVRTEVEARAQSPRDRLQAWFDVLAEWVELDIAAGAPTLRIENEARDPRHPVRGEETRHAAVRDDLRDLAAAAGASDPETLADELQLLVRGAVTEAGRTDSPRPARVAAAAATRLLDTALPPAR
jgi:AcrR family transcriptional regulator